MGGELLVRAPTRFWIRRVRPRSATWIVLIVIAAGYALLMVGTSLRVVVFLPGSTTSDSNTNFGLIRALHQSRQFLDTNTSASVSYATNGKDSDNWADSEYAHIRRNLDYRYHDSYTKDRIRLQDALITSMMANKTSNTSRSTECHSDAAEQQQWIIFTAGVMGVGKSYTIHQLYRRGVLPLDAFIIVDPDEIRMCLPEYENLIQTKPEMAGQQTQKESGLIAEIMVQAGLEHGYNILVDGSLSDARWHEKYFMYLRALRQHLRIAILHVTAPRHVVYRRVDERARVTGRIVPRHLLDQSMEQVPRSVELLRSKVDFAVDLRNSGKEDDIEIITPYVDWGTFRSQWVSTCRKDEVK